MCSHYVRKTSLLETKVYNGLTRNVIKVIIMGKYTDACLISSIETDSRAQLIAFNRRISYEGKARYLSRVERAAFLSLSATRGADRQVPATQAG